MHLHLPSDEHDHGHGHGHGHHHHHHHHDADGAGRLWWVVGLLLLLMLTGTVVWRTVFFVDETEYVYVTQFGQPLRLYTEAGLGIKWPYQSLRRFDRRLQMYEPPGREMLTEDKENLTFQWYVCWRIPGPSFVLAQAAAAGAAKPADDQRSDAQVQPEIEKYVRRFLQSVGSTQAAERRLEERIQAALAAEIGRTRLDRLVSLTPGEVQLEAIAQRATQAIRSVAAEQFGIEVVDVRWKRFNYPEAVRPSVYAEIRSERERVAIQYRAQGASQKSKIESLADLQREQLLAQARREATRLRGEGEAKAIEIFNAAHSKDPVFYELLKTLETYRAILDNQTTIVLSADSPLLKLLTRGLPNLPAASPNVPRGDRSAPAQPPPPAAISAPPGRLENSPSTPPGGPS
jgi:modulator of FtsH protease HflC